MADPQPDESAEPERPRRRPRTPWEGPAEQVYANVLFLAAGPFDVSLVFGQEDHATRTEAGVDRREVVRVAMSWGHLKSMIPLMANMVAQYETEYGEVPAPGFDRLWKGEQ